MTKTQMARQELQLTKPLVKWLPWYTRPTQKLRLKYWKVVQVHSVMIEKKLEVIMIFSLEVWARKKAAPYSAEKYERGVEEQQQQEYDKLGAAEEDHNEGDTNDQ
jgi:hypothetical protein